MSNEAWQMGEARRASRREARAASTLRAGGPEAIDVTVLDLSETGIRIAADVALTIGQEISIGLAGVGARRAYVAWARGGEYGCAFGTPIEPEEVAQAFARGGVVALSRIVLPPETGAQNDQLRDVYASHRLLALPLDAIVFTAGFLGLFAAAFWMIVKP